VQWSELKHCIYSTVSAVVFCYFMMMIAPPPQQQNLQPQSKKTPLKLSNTNRNEMNQKLETAGGA
jgi:hypothetical protein